jgi:hypothetical protein
LWLNLVVTVLLIMCLYNVVRIYRWRNTFGRFFVSRIVLRDDEGYSSITVPPGGVPAESPDQQRTLSLCRVAAG